MKKGTGLIGIIAIAVIAGGLALFSKILPALFKMLVWVGVGIIGLIAILMIVGIIFALKNSSSDAKADAAKKHLKNAGLTADQSEILSNGRSKLLQLRQQAMRIKNTKIHSKSNEICGVIDKILQTLKQKPDDINNCRQFLNYYLPTFGEILEKYKGIEDSGVPNEEISEKVYAYLLDIKTAMDKQYANLFEDDILDMTVDMEAMSLAFKRDGLISEHKVETGEGDQKITLTL